MYAFYEGDSTECKFRLVSSLYRVSSNDKQTHYKFCDGPTGEQIALLIHISYEQELFGCILTDGELWSPIGISYPDFLPSQLRDTGEDDLVTFDGLASPSIMLIGPHIIRAMIYKPTKGDRDVMRNIIGQV